MPSLIFILLVSVASRILWSRRYKIEDFLTELRFMFYIILFEMAYFAFFHLALGINFDI
jgi:hypothetical protein